MADARGNHGEPAQAIPRSEGAGRTRSQVGAARGENHFRHLSYPCRCLFDNHIRRARTPSPRRTAEARCRATEACEADVGHRDLLLCRSGRTKAHRTRRSRVFTRCKINLAPAQNLVCDRSRSWQSWNAAGFNFGADGLFDDISGLDQQTSFRRVGYRRRANRLS
jgi:hypothetical protein